METLTTKPRWADAKILEKEPYNISRSTQSKYRMNKKIPYYRVGKYIKYDLNEIDVWIKEHKVKVA